MTLQRSLRLFVLAGVALIGGVIALGVTRNHRDEPAATSALPQPAPAPGGGWYSALAAAASVPRKPRRTACGETLRANTLGVAHPVLPCNVKIFIEYGDKLVLTQVIDRGPYAQGREFQLTNALAHTIDLQGTHPIRWRYAVAPDAS